MTNEDKAWAAGVVDGEGCIGSYKNGSTWVLRVTVTNSSDKMIARLREFWGGCISQVRSPSRKAHYKDVKCWEVWSGGARQVLTDILPYLVAKKDQAEVGLQILETMSTRGVKLSPEMRARRESLSIELKRLKRVA